jgi:hypothetical protein
MIFPGLIDLLFAEGITLVLGMTGLATVFVFLPLTLFRLRRLGDIRRGGTVTIIGWDHHLYNYAGPTSVPTHEALPNYPRTHYGVENGLTTNDFNVNG